MFFLQKKNSPKFYGHGFDPLPPKRTMSITKQIFYVEVFPKITYCQDKIMYCQNKIQYCQDEIKYCQCKIMYCQGLPVLHLVCRGVSQKVLGV